MGQVNGFNLGKNRKKYIDFVKRVKREGGSYSGVKGRDFKEQLNSLLEYSPSLAVLPNTTKGGKLPTIIPADGSADFTVSRNSTKWVLGKNGYLYEVPANQAAIEFNADGSYKGVLVEPESTNFALDSGDWTTGNWGNPVGGATSLDSSVKAPDGTSDSNKIVGNGTSDVIFWRTQTFTFDSAGTWTISFFAKQTATVRYTRITLSGYTAATNTSGVFDLQQGRVLSGNGTIEEYGNGWYRCTIHPTIDSGDLTGIILIYASAGSSTPSWGTSANANGKTLNAWGLHIEKSPIATSYIPTTTGTATRFADNISLTNASSLIGQTEGTLFVEVDWRNVYTQNPTLLSLNNDTAANRIEIYLVNTDQLRMVIRSNNVDQTAQGESATAYTGIQKIAFAYKQNDCELYRNGASISTDTTVDLSSLATLTNVDFGQWFNADRQANMWIRAVALYTSRLTDAQCIDLTT